MPVETIVPNPSELVVQPPVGSTGAGFSDYTLYMSSVADDLPAWGSSVAARDRAMRTFWPTEPVLAGAMFSTVSKYAAFGWQLKGPSRLVRHYERMLHGAQEGRGWNNYITRLLIDLFSCDNGSFTEIQRTHDSPTAPVTGLVCLDSNRCRRTGRLDEPVIYYDRLGVAHKLKWYHVMDHTEMPTPIEEYYGLQYCVVTRLLRAAQIMKDISVYQREKISGRFTKSVWLVSGVQSKRIEDAMRTNQTQADSQGLSRFITPVILGSLDPTAKVDATKLDLASLPDGFNAEEHMRWYVNQLALAFGGDYMDYAPLPGGGIGSAGNASVISLKSRGKGPRLFMEMLEAQFNFHGIFPTNVTFIYGDQDASEDLDKTKLGNMRAENRAIRIKSGEISPLVARKLAVETGDLPEEFLAELEAWDVEQEAKAQKILETENADPASTGVAEPQQQEDNGAANHVV